jgi:hypothetical protein
MNVHRLSLLWVPLAAGIWASDTAALAQDTNPDSPDPPVSLTAEIAGLHRLDPSCPPPTEKRGSECVLTQDVILDATLDVASFTHLNCQGHRITPTSPGVLGMTNPPSLPAVAVLLRRSWGVKIQNCRIVGFDFGIFALKSKVPAEIRADPGALALVRNKFLGNTVSARFTAISLFQADNTEIAENAIAYTTLGGRGIVIELDSDLNRVTGNAITPDLTPGKSGALKVPGPMGASNPVVGTAGGAILVAHVEGPDPLLFNVVIEGSLDQLVPTQSPTPNEDFSADNLVDGNSISFPHADNDGIALTAPQRTTVSNNTVANATTAIRAGAQVGLRQFPGRCCLECDRYCLTNADCSIPGVDTAPLGTCVLPTRQAVSWPSRDSVIESNTIYGPFTTGGIIFAAESTVVRGNQILGPARPSAMAAISFLGKFALETSTVVRNTISNVAVALQFTKVFQLPAAFFGAKVSLNDFTGFTTAVRTSNDYDLPSDLSVDGKGNYWGIPTCPAFASCAVRFVSGAPNPLVVDNGSYVVPVAQTPDEAVPASCGPVEPPPICH